MAAEVSQFVAPPPDRPLVERLRAGDIRAMEALFRTYYQHLCVFVERYVQSAVHAEQVVEEVFTTLWLKREQLNVPATLRALLFGTARVCALEAANVSIADDGEEPLSLKDAASLDDALAQLPEHRRTVFELRWTHRLSYLEIAAIVGGSVAAIEQQLHRTLTAIRFAVGHPI